jgi:hypothetical protein
MKNIISLGFGILMILITTFLLWMVVVYIPPSTNNAILLSAISFIGYMIAWIFIDNYFNHK